MVGSTTSSSHAEITRDRVEVGVGGERPEVAQRGELAERVVHHPADQQPDERETPWLAHPTGDAEVEQRGLAVGAYVEVAAVEVAVKHAVDERPLHETDHPGSDHGMGVDPVGFIGLEVVEREPVEAFHHEHASRDEVGVGSGYDELVLAELTEHAGHIEHVVGLDAEVELLADRVGEHLDECRRVGERRDGDPSHQHRGEPRHHLQVLVDESVDAGSLHLHDHLGAVAQRGPVDLRDRRRGDRPTIELGEDRFERRTQVGLHDLADGVEPLGGHLVATLHELGHQLRREDPLAARDDLSELDVGGPEDLGRLPEPSRQVGLRLRTALAPPEEPPGGDRPARMAQHGEGAPPGRAPAGRHEPGKLPVGGSAQGGHAVAPAQLVIGNAPGVAHPSSFTQPSNDANAASAASASSGRHTSRSGR